MTISKNASIACNPSRSAGDRVLAVLFPGITNSGMVVFCYVEGKLKNRSSQTWLQLVSRSADFHDRPKARKMHDCDLRRLPSPNLKLPSRLRDKLQIMAQAHMHMYVYIYIYIVPTISADLFQRSSTLAYICNKPIPSNSPTCELQKTIPFEVTIRRLQSIRGARGTGGEGYTGVGTRQKTIQSPDRLYKAPTDYRNP